MMPARLIVLSIAAWIAWHTGLHRLPLQYPGVGMYAHSTPSDVHPWKPRPMEGMWAGTHELQATRLFEGLVRGSESVTMSPDGKFAMLDKYGYVFVAEEGKNTGNLELNPTPVAHLGAGRPLGARFDGNGDLIVCDSFKGLLKVHWDTKEVEVLANRISASSPLAPNTPLMYANDIDIAADGTIWFTASVNVYPHRSAQWTDGIWHIPSLLGQPGFYDTWKGWGLGLCQGLPKGQLLTYDPRTKETKVVKDGFWYSNGVALSEAEDYIAMSETDRIRVLKIWLKGPKAGETEVLIDRLPGAPDGLSRASDGNLWVPLVGKVPPVSKKFGSRVFRFMLSWMPETWRPPMPVWGAVLKVTPGGQLVTFLLDPDGTTASRIASAHEEHGRLYFGNLVTDYVSYIRLEDLPSMAKPVNHTGTTHSS